MITVQLESYEMECAEDVGRRRRKSSDGYTFRTGRGDSTNMDVDILGAQAEMAVAKALNLYWPAGVGTFKNVLDVPPFEVQTTQLGLNLILRDSDLHDSVTKSTPYILVWNVVPEFILVGWYSRQDYLDPSWRRSDYWLVPHHRLNQMEDHEVYNKFAIL